MDKKIKLELAFKHQKFTGIVLSGANNYFIEDGEVVDYIHKLEAQKEKLIKEIKKHKK